MHLITRFFGLGLSLSTTDREIDNEMRYLEETQVHSDLGSFVKINILNYIV